MDKTSLKFRILMLFYFLFGLAVILTPITSLVRPQREVNEYIADVMKVTCKIESEFGLTGTGILLDTGYIVTAGHLVASDSVICKKFTLEFYDELGNPIYGDAELVYLSNVNDFAILSHNVDIKSNLRFCHKKVTIGEPIFTVGSPLCHTLVTSSGYIANGFGARQMSSVYVAPGNSGGTLFSLVDGKPVGIVSACGLLEVYGRTETMVEERGIWRRFAGRTVTAVPQNAVSFFLPYETIYNELEGVSLESFLTAHTIDIDYVKYFAAISKILLISLIAYSVWKIT